jgi:hypothetical protein
VLKSKSPTDSKSKGEEAMSIFPKSLAALAVFSILALTAWAQSQTPSPTPPSTAPARPSGIAQDQADLSKARGQYEADRANALSIKQKLDADMKQYGPNSAQVAQDRQQLQTAKVALQRDRNIVQNTRKDVQGDKAQIRRNRRAP